MRFKFSGSLKVIGIYFLIFGGLILCGCGTKEVTIDEGLLSEYNKMANPNDLAVAAENIDCYLDYSFGMGEGMKVTSSMNDKLKNFLGGRKVTFYKVGSLDNPLQIDINSTESNFLNIDNFKEPGSKLKVAVDKIIKNKNKISIFITDFERVEDVSQKQNLTGAPNPHPIDASAWAQNHFKEWLKTGNQIDIFAKKFSKPDFWFDKNHKQVYDNWIYTLIFTPSAVIKDENAYKTSVLKFMNDEYQNANGTDSKHFTYTTNNFEIEQEKKDETMGDANDNMIVIANITNTLGKGFEYYEFSSQDVLKLNSDESQKDKRIINKIKITPNIPCFSDIQFGVKSYDITKSLTDFFNSMNQEAPVVNTDIETGVKDTVANKPIKYNYQKGEEVKDVFDFVYNTATKEIGIKVKQEFTGVSQNTIYQVDVVISGAKLQDFTDADNVLKLNYAQGYTINSLGESVKLALRDVAASIQNKVLYTIYIKIDK